MINDGYECALTMEKCIIFGESVAREYNINCEEAELKVLKESGTNEDLKYLCEAAKEGLVVKLKKAIKKMIVAFKNFITNIVDKIKVTYASKKSNDVLQKLEDASNSNPKVKAMKITVHDGEKDEKAIQEAIDKLYAQKAKLKGGASVDNVKTAVDDIKEQTEKKRQKIAKAATLTISIGAAVLLMRKYIKKLDSDNSEAIKEAQKLAKNMEDIDVDDDRVAQTIFNVNSNILVLARERLSSMVGFIREIGYKAKGQMAVPNYEESADDTSYTESYDDIYTPATTVDDEITEESVGAEEVMDESYIDSLFSDIENSVTTESEDDTTEIDDNEDVSYESTLDAYLDHLIDESNSDTEETATESTVSDLDAMLDDIASGLTTESSNSNDELDAMLDNMTSDITTESTDDVDLDSLLDEIVGTI